MQKDRGVGLRFAAFSGVGLATIHVLCRSSSCAPRGIINSIKRRNFN